MFFSNNTSFISRLNSNSNSNSNNTIKAGAIILDKSKKFILLIKGNYANKWNVPKGTHENNESIRVTAKREIFEETGLDLNISKYEIPIKLNKAFLYVLYIDKNIPIQPIDILEIKEAKWIPIHELDNLEDKSMLLKKVMVYISNNFK